MKKLPFIILLTVELLASLISVGLLLANLGILSYLIAAVVFAALLTHFFRKLKKTDDETKRAAIRRNILLILLIPIALAILAILAVVISLFLYLG